MVEEPEAGAANDPARAARHPVITVFTSHWLAMTGLGLILTSIIVWACLVPARLQRGGENPYTGVATLVVAAVFVLGLAITPLGLHFGRKRLRTRLSGVLAANSSAWMRLGAFLLIVSLINVAIISQLALNAVHTMESRQFCGSCHVMTPEQRAFDQGSHAGILCVDCHVGEGAKGFIASKIQGTKQLLLVLTDKVPKPIEGAISSGLMVPSSETCEQCHWKRMPAKASLQLYVRYGDDEANTPETTLLTMNVGGEATGGIHGAHHGSGVSIRFVATDRHRMEIPLVEYEDAAGKTRTFVKSGVKAADLADQPRITMQCFDCHSRPAHSFELPDRAVDRAIMLGRMSATLPFVKKTAVEILKAGYADSAAAAAAIPAAVKAWYAKNQPDAASKRAADVEEAGRVIAEIYSRNVFPEYGVDWGTYPNQLGHTDTLPGCFRCHDGDHATATGEKITNDCFKCHFPSAVDEQKPEVVKLLGLDSMLLKLRKK